MVPSHEPVQTAMRSDDIKPWPQPQVKGVAQHDVRIDLLKLERTHRLHRAIGAHRHEGRRFHPAVRKSQRAAPCRAVADFQIKCNHCFNFSNTRRNPAGGGEVAGSQHTVFTKPGVAAARWGHTQAITASSGQSAWHHRS